MRDPAILLNDLKLPKNEGAKAIHRQYPRGEPVMIYSVPFQAADGRLFEVEAGTSLLRMTQTMRWLEKILFAATVVILVLATFGGYFLMVQPLRPLVTLTEKAADIGRNKLGERLPVIPTGDELERLTHSLNGMIDRLEQALAHNYRFSADASHELRTPLTIMRGELEEMLRAKELPAEVVDGLVSTLEEIDRMSRIVNSLMAITRLDAGGERMDLQAVDLSALVQQTTDHLQLLADEKGLPLICTCEPEVFVHADPMRLKQVIVNLVDNAIKYTPAEAAGTDELGEPGITTAGFVDREASVRGAVRVTVSTVGSSAQLEIADQGIGIPPHALEHVFDRFYRADYARSRGAGGVGLGLAIVKSIIAALDGTVAIRSTEGQGSTVTVILPLVRGGGVPSRDKNVAGRRQPSYQSV
jgi:signal transduction histidine kinase